MKRIGLVVKNDARALEKADALQSWFAAGGVQVIRKPSVLPSRELALDMGDSAPSDLFCVLVLGGDGTFLSAVAWIGDQEIPILGVKFGEVGFLAGITEEDLFPAMEAVLKGGFSVERRMQLQVCVYREKRVLAQKTVLNDVVVNKGALARLAHIKTFIDDGYLTTYSADGLIVATPTGSTAYSLAAGGPIIHPAVPAMVMTPICPFTLTNRPLIIPDTSCITIQLAKRATHVMVTFDGQAGIEIYEEDKIVVKKAPYTVAMIALPGQRYYDLLKNKLRWSGGRV
ncbi:MAG: NAD(+) kinase [Desulfobacterales bacterium CG07_land_8_20_14_0_80_52_14]|nr:MAG: NAD(+) kinase [Desulfobacterales bacterium CG23_combo_of_CG06-09_8_20_14_all_52_9]PIU49174.1 MAG: NAD(+) kinase [Desulfobacterales bacterium CG07_land_8_20_14_0_80_52_14]